MKILVTGCAGFIGSHLIDRLLKDNHQIVGVDHLSDNYSPMIKLKAIQHNFSNPNFTFLVKNTKEKEKMEVLFKKYEFDVVIHLAAYAGVRASIEQVLQFRDTNINSTVNLLELSKQFHIKNFIYASSSSVYANNKKIPFSEDDPVENPISPYATTKRACELFCYTYNYLCGLNIITLRFFNVFGPRNRPDMAHFKFTKAIYEDKEILKYGDGSTSRDYTYVEDIVEGINACIDKQLGYEIINLGNNEPVTLNEMIATLEETIGKKAKIKEVDIPPGDALRTYADISKAKRLLNWEPKTSYKEGVKKLIDWYKKEYDK